MSRVLDYFRVSLLGCILIGLLGNLVYNVYHSSSLSRAVCVFSFLLWGPFISRMLNIYFIPHLLQPLTMKTDYKLCKAFEKDKMNETLLKNCKAMIDLAFKEVNSKCQRQVNNSSEQLIQLKSQIVLKSLPFTSVFVYHHCQVHRIPPIL